MTPLAHRLVRRLALPVKHRETVREWDNAIAQINDIHCFECSAIAELIGSWKLTENKAVANTLKFLPAPRTWIEWKANSGTRMAGLLIEHESKTGCDAFFYIGHTDSPPSGRRIGHLSYLERGIAVDVFRDGDEATLDRAIVEKFAMFVAMINAPRIIGRKQHMPNRGLERKLTKAFGVGKFPLHAWNEIKLDVFKPVEIDDGEPHEAHLTGHRALHFCRAHLRIRLGKLEYVSSHWRGDAALGIKQTRYVVTPRQS